MTITHKTYRNITILFIAALLVLFAASVVARIERLEEQTATHEKFELVTAITRAVDGVRTPTLRDKDNKQIVPEVRLELPALQDKVGTVSYNIASVKSPLEMNISSDRLTNDEKSPLLGDARLSTEQIIHKVGKLQACARGVYVLDYQIKDNDNGYGSNYGSKKLKNGKTVYFYTEDTCKNEDLLNYVKNIESY